jgi:methylated-DNA-[protein]-cysteine S-methyltransferase
MSLVHDSALGPLALDASPAGLTSCRFGAPAESTGGDTAMLDLARREIDAYLAGDLRAFTVPVDLSSLPATDRRVLTALAEVGHGATTTYGALATAAGLQVRDARRVGGVLARNPVWLVVPCHRVVAADGALTGYAGGLAMKRWLLDLEARDHTPALF